jgi:hypothetical protein
MKSMLFVLALSVSVNSFAGDIFATTKDLADDVTNITLSDASYGKLVTKTEVRQIPGCDVTADRHPVDCLETVVLERTPVVAVYVTYNDPSRLEDQYNKQAVAFNFSPEVLSAEDLAALKNTRNPFSRIKERIAKKNFSLEVKRVQRTIQVVDYDRSTICTVGENGEVEWGCVQNIVYKPGLKWVKELTVTKK